MIEFVQYLINGLAIGSLYALIAVGYSMVYGILQLVNFAHAEIYMLGAYMVMMLVSQGFSLPVAFSMAAVGVGLFAVIAERLLYKPLRSQDRLAPLITAVGLSLFLQNVVQGIFTPNPLSYPIQLSGEILALTESGLFVRERDIIIFVATLSLTGAFELFIRKTKPGSGMRAVAMHPLAARIVGVPFDRAVGITFFLGAVMAVIAGTLQGMAFNQIWPYMGVAAGLKAFAAAVLGGIGVLSGALAGGLILGVAESLLVGYDLGTYKDGIAFLILIIVLLFRPQGLLGKIRMVKV